MFLTRRKKKQEESKDSTKFVPLQEVSGLLDSSHYRVVNKLSQLQWYSFQEAEAAERNGNGNGVLSNSNSSSSSSISSMASKFNILKRSMETRVETQTLYFTDLQSGKSGFIQLLYSSVMDGVYKGFQLNFKLFHAKDSGTDDEEEIWESFKLDHSPFELTATKIVFHNCSFELVKTEKKDCIAQLNIKIDITREHTDNKHDLHIDLCADLYQGFTVKPDGCNYYLDKHVEVNDLFHMNVSEAANKKILRHMYVPRGACHGEISYCNKTTNKMTKIKLENVPISYIDAVQGILPNKAAKSWNFLCFHSKTQSILYMEFTTIAEYGQHTVSTWSTTRNGKLEDIRCAVDKPNTKAIFLKSVHDKENGWDYPEQIQFPMEFRENHLRLVNRYDIMNELPSFIKKLAQNIAHVKPYIYQYCQQSNYKHETGISIIESTFIS